MCIYIYIYIPLSPVPGIDAVPEHPPISSTISYYKLLNNQHVLNIMINYLLPPVTGIDLVPEHPPEGRRVVHGAAALAARSVAASMLYYAMLCYAMLYYTILYYAMLD